MSFARGHILLGIATALIVFLVGVWTSLLPLVSRICLDTSIPLAERLALSSHLLSSSIFDLAPFDTLLLITISILIGINVALIMLYVRARRTFLRSAGAAGGLFGTITALFGFGCAACGTLAVSPLLVALGASGALALLPFGGEELKYVGILLLILSVYFLARDINKPDVCRV